MKGAVDSSEEAEGVKKTADKGNGPKNDGDIDKIVQENNKEIHQRRLKERRKLLTKVMDQRIMKILIK